MKKIGLKALFILFFVFSLSCKKDSLDDYFLTDGMIVFTLDGKDWIVKNMVASYSDLSDIDGGQFITISGSVEVNLTTYKTIELYIKDTESISDIAYTFTAGDNSGAKIIINEGKTSITGYLFNTTNPDESVTGNGKINISNFDRIENTITGSFSGEIYKTSYTDNTNTGWVKTSIKSGRFSNIPVIIGK